MDLREVCLLVSALAILCAHLWMRLQRPHVRDKATQTEAKPFDEWMDLTLEALRNQARAEGLGTSGLKEDLCHRLVRKRAQLEAQTKVV